MTCPGARALPVLLFLLLGVAGTAGLAGCGRNEVDRAQLETQVQRSLEDMASPKLDVRMVSCPEHLAAQKGATTHCSITTMAGKTVTALVTVTGTANSRLQFDLKLEQNPES